MSMQTGVTVGKRLSKVLTSVTLTLNILSLVITSGNFMTIRWWEHSEKGVTDRQTDWAIHRAAWSQLKMLVLTSISINSNSFSKEINRGETIRYCHDMIHISIQVSHKTTIHRVANLWKLTSVTNCNHSIFAYFYTNFSIFVWKQQIN